MFPSSLSVAFKPILLSFNRSIGLRAFIVTLLAVITGFSFFIGVELSPLLIVYVQVVLLLLFKFFFSINRLDKSCFIVKSPLEFTFALIYS